MANPYPFQVQKGNIIKFNTQLKSHLSSPHTVHLFDINKSCDISIIMQQLPSILQFQKNWPKNPNVPATFEMGVEFRVVFNTRVSMKYPEKMVE